MSVYFDASVIVAIFLPDVFGARIDAYLVRDAPAALVSDFAATEFAAVVGVRLRRGEIDLTGARRVFAEFDVWRAAHTARCETSAADLIFAEALLRRLDLPLRAPDAIHLSIANRLSIPVATFDVRMAEAARSLGLEVADA